MHYSKSSYAATVATPENPSKQIYTPFIQSNMAHGSSKPKITDPGITDHILFSTEPDNKDRILNEIRLRLKILITLFLTVRTEKVPLHGKDFVPAVVTLLLRILLPEAFRQLDEPNNQTSMTPTEAVKSTFSSIKNKVNTIWDRFTIKTTISLVDYLMNNILKTDNTDVLKRTNERLKEFVFLDAGGIRKSFLGAMLPQNITDNNNILDKLLPEDMAKSLKGGGGERDEEKSRSTKITSSRRGRPRKTNNTGGVHNENKSRSYETTTTKSSPKKQKSTSSSAKK